MKFNNIGYNYRGYIFFWEEVFLFFSSLSIMFQIQGGTYMGIVYKKPNIESCSVGVIAEKLGICQNQYDGSIPQSTTIIIQSIAGNSSGNVDGYVMSGGSVISGNFLIAGDSALNATSRSFAGFDISSLVGKTIVSATLEVYQGNVNENPYGLGDLIVDRVDFGDSIDSSDYGASALTSNIGTISTDSLDGSKSLDVTDTLRNDLIAGRMFSQYRLRFATTTDNDNLNDNVYLTDAEENGGEGYGPRLVVSYY
jgi:hypothetical protein